MPEPPSSQPAGAADAPRAGGAPRPLAERFARHAASLERAGRSPLYRELMRGAAGSAASGGVVAELFASIDLPPGAVPSLKLMAALHHLVLSGAAPELAEYFPDAGGTRGALGAWPVAERTIAGQFDAVRDRARRPVQTNEPGRCVALYGALLWLVERHPLPVRLLELGASAGLGLIPDRYAYAVDGLELGRRGSPVRFEQPWTGRPVADPAAGDRGLRIVERAGCDPAPLELTTPDGRLTAMSYIWPDEAGRLARVAAAIDLLLSDPVRVDPMPASEWLAGGPAVPAGGALTVVWQSVVRQYLPAAERRAVDRALHEAGGAAGPDRPLARVTLEPAGGQVEDFTLECTRWPGGETVVLGRVGNHGVPAVWALSA